MPKRKIKIKSFVWQKKDEDYNGDEITVTVQSRMGEEVDLPSKVAAYGDDMGAFVTPEDEAAESEQAAAVEDMDHEELTNWVSDSTIPEILTVAKANPELSSDLLEAENAATGNDPRTGLVDGLAQIAGSGEGSTASEEEAVEDDVDSVAEKLGVDLENVEGTGEDGIVTVDDVKEYYDEEIADATDGAVELAEDKDTYLADVTGSGKDGRITKEDVEKYLEAQSQA